MVQHEGRHTRRVRVHDVQQGQRLVPEPRNIVGREMRKRFIATRLRNRNGT